MMRCVVFMVASAVASESLYLTGELVGEYGPDTFTVTGTIYVPLGERLSFRPGSVVRFEPFTGIVVRGRLACNGEPDMPIVFTSIRDHVVGGMGLGAEAFDWNGIKVTAEGSLVRMTHVMLRYSTFGLDIASNATGISKARSDTCSRSQARRQPA